MTTKEQAMTITPEQAATAKFMKTPATSELKEAVVKVAEERTGVDVKEILDITGNTPADIIDTLFMKVIDGELYRGKYNFYLTDIFNKKVVRLGNAEYKYAELDDTSDTLDIQAANSIDDFNGEYVPELAEVYKLETPFHKKVKVPEMVLSNAWATAENMVEFVMLQVESMDKALARRWENMAWTEVMASATQVEVTGTEAIDYTKAMVKEIEQLGTTSNEHASIGTDGVITISTVTGDKTVQPDLYFDASEFVLFIDTEQFVDETFTNEAQWFNYAATSVNWAKIQPMAFSKYAGFRAITDSAAAEVAPAVVIPTGLKMIAVHKNYVELLEQYSYTETLKGRGPWSVTHNHRNLGIYNIKTTPAIAIIEAPVAP